MMDTPSGWTPGVIEAVREQIFAHPDRLSSGVLVGTSGVDGVRVNAVIGTRAGARTTTEPLDQAAWGYVHEVLSRVYPGQCAIGWYVARSGFDARVTEIDVKTHERFFGPNRFLLIVDPATAGAAGYVGVAGGVAEMFRGSLDDHQFGVSERAIGSLPLERPMIWGALAGVLLWLLTGADAGVLR